MNNRGVDLDRNIKLLRSFGFEGEDYIMVGINGKNSEFHAAMGLCNLNYIDEIILKRKRLTEAYDALFGFNIVRPYIPEGTEYNYAYYPVIFGTEEELLYVHNKLKQNHIDTRRYFYPSLNNLPYLLNFRACPISEDIAKRILCLPLFSELTIEDVDHIVELMGKRSDKILL